jgi:hypothetical protein
MCGEGGQPHSPILTVGASTVFANAKQIGRMGDALSCGSFVVTGSGNVIIGSGKGNPPNLGIDATPYSNLQPFVVVINGETLNFSKETIKSIIEDTPDVDTGPKTPSTPSDAPPEPSPPDAPPDTTDCAELTQANSSFKLSQNFTLGQLSSQAIVSKSAIQPQHGLSLQDIACNLKAVAENLLEPLLAYVGPKVVVTSGFRIGGSRSQHELGQAVDVQLTGTSNDQMFEIAKWVKENLPYDQFIYEYNGNKPWLHMSYNRAGNRAGSASNKFGSKPISGYIWRSIVDIA